MTINVRNILKWLSINNLFLGIKFKINSSSFSLVLSTALEIIKAAAQHTDH